MTKKKTKATAFVPDTFEELGSGLVIPKQPEGPDPATASLRELETPDQLEERDGKAANVEVREIEYNVPDVDAEPEVDTTEPEDLYPVRQSLREKHPDWESDPAWQIEMFTDMLKLSEAEHEQIKSRMDEIEILLQLYPLHASQSDLDELRKLIRRGAEIQTEKQLIVQMIMARKHWLKQQEEAELAKSAPPPPPPKKGVFGRVLDAIKG